jgi:phosphomannomutase
MNFQIEDKKGAMEKLKNHFVQQEEPTEILDFDGYRLEFKDWWFNVRPSNTEPYLRLIIEAHSQELLEEKTEEIQKLLEKF